MVKGPIPGEKGGAILAPLFQCFPLSALLWSGVRLRVSKFPDRSRIPLLLFEPASSDGTCSGISDDVYGI